MLETYLRCQFLEDSHEIDGETNRTSRELRVLSIILENISQELTVRVLNADQMSLVRQVLQLANEDLDKLHALATKSVARLKQLRKGKQTRVLWQQSGLLYFRKKMKDQVESTKNTLNALQSQRLVF